MIKLGDFTFPPRPDAGGGWWYEKLEDWFTLTGSKSERSSRPVWHGSFSPGVPYRESASPSFTLHYDGESAADAAQALRQLVGLGRHGDLIPMTVDAHDGELTRMVEVKNIDVPDTHGSELVTATVYCWAPDPLAYGPLVSASTGVPTAGVGVADPLLDPFQVGTLTEVGRNLFTNPRFVGGGGEYRVARGGTIADNDPDFVIDGTDMVAQKVRGMSAGAGAALIVSTFNGKPAARLINGSGAAASVFASFAVPVGPVRALGTWMATRNQVQVNSQATGGYNLLVSAPNQQTAPTNVVGSVEGRLIFSALTGTYVAYLGSRANPGGGDVWWTDIGLFAGDYAGPAVSGDSPPSGDLVYVWAGQRDNSETIIYQVDASAEGNLGRVAFTNSGKAPTSVEIAVTGGLSAGVKIHVIETGQTLRLERLIPDGSVIRFNSRTGRATIDGQSDVTGFLTVDEWPMVPPETTYTFQFTPLGTASGVPQMTVSARPAFF